MNVKVIIIVAIDENGAIGYQNNLLFHISADLKRFKELTTGHTIIMGRRTFESLPKGALPNRRNIVLTSQDKSTFQGADCYKSLSQAIESCPVGESVFIIGGASVYREAINIANCLEVTEIHAKAPLADVYFPKIDKSIWHKKEVVSHPQDEKHNFSYDFVTYVREA